MHKRKIINFNSIGLIGVSALSLLAIAMLCPTISKTTSALQCNGNEGEAGECEEGYSSTTATMSVDVPVASMISIGLQNELTIEITPKSTNNEVARGIAKLAVDTNNESGYAVYMTTQNGTSLTSGSSNALSQKIESIESAGSITDNKWGYAIGAPGTGETVETFSPIPSTSKQITATTATDASKTDTYDLTFGVLINTDLPAGLYSGSVVVSAVANPIEVSNLRQLVFMQDMKGSICENTPMPQNVNGEEITVTKQLVDIRDGKRYWVAKLRDGNCWMTQNLALDLSTSRTLTPADTNVTSNYTPESNTRVDDSVNTETNANGSYKLSPAFDGTEVTNPSYTTQYSWGKWKNTILATPWYGRRCNTYNSSGGDSAKSSDALFQVCSGSGFIDVTGWLPSYIAQQDTIRLDAGNDTDTASSSPRYPYNYTGLIAADINNQTYDAHYLVGNYYQWNTATAGTGGTITSKNAASSICPKGWTLPRSGNNSSISGSLNTDNGTFANLLKAYGVGSKLSSTADSAMEITLRNYSTKLSAATDINGNATEYGIKAEEFNIAGTPLYFVRSGCVDLVGSTDMVKGAYLDDAGSQSHYLSITATDSSSGRYTYSLHINNQLTSPQVTSSTNEARYAGQSLRCLQE